MRRQIALALFCAPFSLGTVARLPTRAAVPFGAGERLTFVVRTAALGTIGHAVMALTEGAAVRGTPTVLASFDTHVSVVFMKGSNDSRSWIDLPHMTSLRFARHERGPLASNDDSVEIFPAGRRWVGLHGDSGTTASAAPLDELSFMYFLRTVSFAPDSTYSFDRHYDRRRIPTTVRVVKHETLDTPAGRFGTVELEMRTKDAIDYHGTGVLHVWLSDDPCRVPVRIESDMPVIGDGVLTLVTAVSPGCDAGEPAVRTHYKEY